MAEIKIPIKIDGFECVEDMAQAVLNYTYKGKTLKEWADSISKPQTNADRIRAMTDEELADFIGGIFTIERDMWGDYDPRTVVTQEPRVEVRNKEDMLDWLKQEAEE